MTFSQFFGVGGRSKEIKESYVQQPLDYGRNSHYGDEWRISCYMVVMENWKPKIMPHEPMLRWAEMAEMAGSGCHEGFFKGYTPRLETFDQGKTWKRHLINHQAFRVFFVCLQKHPDQVLILRGIPWDLEMAWGENKNWPAILPICQVSKPSSVHIDTWKVAFFDTLSFYVILHTSTQKPARMDQNWVPSHCWARFHWAVPPGWSMRCDTIAGKKVVL